MKLHGILTPLMLVLIALAGFSVVAAPSVATWTPSTAIADSASVEASRETVAGVNTEIRLASAEAGSTLPMETAATISLPQAMVYELYQVQVWAAAHSPEGNLLASEAKTALCSADSKDEESRCSAALIYCVLSELALGRRADDAAVAAKTYHQWIAAMEALTLARGAITTHQKLIDLANQAERLELPDGDSRKLQQQLLTLRDTETQQIFAVQKLRQELARLTGRPESEVAYAVPGNALFDNAPVIDAPSAVVAATTQRHDLQAVRNLCRGMSRCSLPAARQLLGAISPGAGLSLASLATAGGLFACLKDDPSDDDLAARKRQCEEIRVSLTATVRHQTLQAVLDVRLAQARLELVRQQLPIAEQRLHETKAAIRIDKASAGSDLLIELEIHSLEADRLARQLKLAETLDELERVKNQPLHVRY